MKFKFIQCLFVTAIIFGLAIQFEAKAQEKADIVFMTNGEQKSGKVIGVTPEIVKFKYTGEDLEYEIAKENIAKIQFSSGRVEEFTRTLNSGTSISSQSAMPNQSTDVHNKIAVLPFQFISNDPGFDPSALSNLAQNTTANSIKEQYGSLTLQDPITTNALLAKNSIDHTNISSMTPEEVSNLLGVEFIVYGTVNLTNKGASTYGSTGTSYSQREKNNSNRSSSDTRTKGSIFSSSSSSTTVEYDTSVDFRLFNNRGTNLYSDSRHVFGTDANAYTAGIDYMIKRTPFGSKYGKK
ncbi:hypothetical protein JYB64_11820 [Algoriphagus aestuarii]|nr:hypothetical protein [Algoriphagus aestuarii]